MSVSAPITGFFPLGCFINNDHNKKGGGLEGLYKAILNIQETILTISGHNASFHPLLANSTHQVGTCPRW